MEKNRIRPIKSGRSIRMSYQRQKEVLEIPNLIEVQKNSYNWFVTDGLREIFTDISPIEDYSGKLSLEFVDFRLCRDEIKYPIEECKERDANFEAPLKVTVRLHNKENGEIKEHEEYMGTLPLMTDTGTFIINGAERVIVSQLVRSPGIYYGISHDKNGKKLYTCTVIPNRGAWLEYETDSNDVFYVRVDRTRKVPVTVLIRALGVGTNQEIIELFGAMNPRSRLRSRKIRRPIIMRVSSNCIKKSVPENLWRSIPLSFRCRISFLMRGDMTWRKSAGTSTTKSSVSATGSADLLWLRMSSTPRAVK